MAIDGIGRGGKIGGPMGPGGADPTTSGKEAGPAFEVKRSERSAAPEGASAVVGAQVTPLDRLRAGQVDVSGYMDLKIGEATAHLGGLSPTQLDSIKRVLRDKLESDPALAELVRGATGQAPPVPDE